LQIQREHPILEQLWTQGLTRPWRDLSSRPRKEIRSQFVELGFLLAGGNLEQMETSYRPRLQSLREAIEMLYLGAVIIDDIEGDALQRLGGPSLHRQYGLPVALNLGNYLYFAALEKIREADFPLATKTLLYEHYHKTMLEGHRGQALDLCTRVDELDPASVEEVCWKSLQMKGGSLAGLALKMGALAYNRQTDEKTDEQVLLETLEEIGVRLGVSLQMHDDVHALSLHKRGGKYLKNLMLRRPSWIWACLVRHFDMQEFVLFRLAVAELPEVSSLIEFLEKTELKEKASAENARYLSEIMTLMKTKFDLPEDHHACRHLRSISEKYSLGEL
jgi:geranylgeranyl pyrophosphate synthase